MKGCFKKLSARGYCHKHYQRWKRYGNPNIIKKHRQEKCDKCKDKHYSRGLCKTHYEIWRYKSNINIKNKNCILCGDRHHAKGLCRKCYGKKVRLKLMDILGERQCVRCGFCDIRALQIEHKNGGGQKDLKKFGNSQKMYQYYIKYPKTAIKQLQIFCSNCNWIKREQNNETK